MTNFFSLAALAKTASFHSPQKPSLLSIGAAVGRECEQERQEQGGAADHGVSVPVSRQHVRAFCPLKHTGP
jgi:hypothetical protein